MHDMLTIAISNRGRLSVCLSRGFAEQTRLDGLMFCLGCTFGDLRNIVLNGRPDFLYGFDAAFTLAT